ncbi:hydrolase [Flavobacterium magnum]|uniref:Hydrolase n=1 Tax=Flavobacterium magnum TaxID=2162713 RepID=A0A2S0RBC1_9FLAO|nr:DUF5916 domain-containing protein [Flavobacterium magnum]AWA28869.1 hydrolase [Flavobacterium magnum]
MSKIHQVFLSLLLLTGVNVFAQKKILVARNTSEKITVDGKFTEAAWTTAPLAGDFVMFQPDNGKPIDSAKNTEVRILYDNDAVYIAATMHDDDPSKIRKEITQRDNVGTADIFGVFINGFNDGQQDFQFFVTASGVQLDRLATEDGAVSPDNFNQDFSWDGIWDSKVLITDFGWTVEMKIPYAALRFSKEKVQTWGLNFYRSIRRDRQHYTWSPIDSEIRSTRNQNGVLEGIENVKTSTRLFFIPYSSYYYENNESGSANKFKAGMDIKYGINDSFTLDAILIPDFGQTRFDNVILNLSPFEQQFSENRPFFTEGTDLFNKGALLYSRRIGGAPRFQPEDFDPVNETIANAPATVNLLNAVKVSGRTKKGLGIGVLNAVTERTYATVQNTATGEKREGVVEPLTNYNVLVLDQRFNQNSSVTLVNTNTLREGHYRDANVAGLLFDLNTKENSYNLSGDFKYSTIYSASQTDGFKTSLNFEKTSGKYRYTIFGKYLSADYDINDLGIAFQSDYHNIYADFSYRILNPTKVFNTFRTDVKSSLELENTTGKLQDNFINFSAEGNTRRNDYYRLLFQANPLESFDFYQPRISGRYSYIPRSITTLFVFSSNYNNTLAIDFNPSVKWYDEKGRRDYGFFFSPRYRINDKILLIYGFNYVRSMNDRGYVGHDPTNIYYAERNIKTITNELSGKLALNNKMTINLTARYYWSFSDNHDFFVLQNDGHLSPATLVSVLDENFNVWNFDLSYAWWFAPASQISILYRNNALDYRNDIRRGIGENLKNLFDNSLNNIFSVSFRYYIDYNSARKWF